MPEQTLDAPVEVVEDEHKGLAGLSEEAKSIVAELRKENAKRRVAAKEAAKENEELKARIKAEEESKMAADGKLQELLDSRTKELEELKPYKDKADANDKYFSEQLDVTLGKLKGSQADLIRESQMIPSDKLKWALKLVDETKSSKDSPDSARPGGDAPEKEIDLKDYEGPEGRAKLLALKLTNPELMERILRAKNQ